MTPFSSKENIGHCASFSERGIVLWIHISQNEIVHNYSVLYSAVIKNNQDH